MVSRSTLAGERQISFVRRVRSSDFLPGMTRSAFFLLVALMLPQKASTGGAITRYVPPAPTPASFISDLAGVLPADAHTALDARISGIQTRGLGDIAVAILPDIGDYSPNQVSVEIYRTWKVGSMADIGSAHRDVGVLLLIVPKELSPTHHGECWITTGLGTEGILTDNTAGTICRDSIIPHLKSRDYGAAIGGGLAAIEARLRGDVGLATPPASQSVPLPPAPNDASSNGGLIASILGSIAAFLAALAGGAHWWRNRPRTCARCGRKMRLLDETSDDAKLDAGQRIEEELKSVDYDVWVCECGESAVIAHTAWFSRYSECRECHRRTASHVRTVIEPATTVSSGQAEDRFDCQSCRAFWVQYITLPQIVVTTSSSSGGGASGSAGGGSSSSFGGSGSTSGGGGGGSY